MKFFANAKINLYLEVTGKDESDGYHYIDSIFQEISLADEIELSVIKEKTSENRIEFYTDFSDYQITGDMNKKSTVHKAVDLFQEKFGVEDCFDIRIKKVIPMGAGLGGGSSDAAFVLMKLAVIYGIEKNELTDIGYKVGSDVPYFFYGGICRVRGKGEIIEPLNSRIDNTSLLIVYPGIHVSTAKAYSLIKDYGNSKNIDAFLKLSAYNVDFLRENVYNKFQRFVMRTECELGLLKDELDEMLRPVFSSMSGSGSSLIFGFEDTKRAQKSLQMIQRSTKYRAFICIPVYR